MLSLRRTPLRCVQRRTFSAGTIKKVKRASGKVNSIYEPQSKALPDLQPINNKSTLSYNNSHNLSEWDSDTIRESLSKHCLMAWGATDAMRNNAVEISSSDGVYLFDNTGKKYIDFSSQAVCVNLGHTIPDSIRESINAQMDKVSFLYGGLAYSEIRARLCSLLSEICPGNINGFLFPSSGAEANECAIRIARKYTGKKKIMTRYRSYHGGTLAALAATGDNRRWDVEYSATGFVKIFDPYPMFFKWNESGNEDDIAEMALHALHEQILHENPNDIAAIMMEPITGTNGWLKPPTKYMQGVRALCDEYGILMICDEVMAGFGRTGKMFSFEHFDGVIPDVMTFAKGITGSYVPLSGVGVSDDILDHFRNVPLGYGSTFQSHPIALSCAYGVVKYLLDNQIVDHSAKMEKVIAKEMQTLIDNSNDTVAQGRVHGMGGCIDVMNPETSDIICSTNEVHPKMMNLKKQLNENGFISLVRGPVVHVCPPLIAQETDIKYGFEILHRSLQQVFHGKR